MLNNRKRLLIAGSSLTMIALVGCGGGGSSAPGASNTGPVSVNDGDARITYAGIASHFTSGYGSNGLVVSGMAGANIVELYLKPTPNMANTTIAFSTLVGSATPITEIFSNTGNIVSQITRGVDGCKSPHFSPTGQIIYSFNDPVTKAQQIAVCNYDGSGFKQLTTGASVHADPVWSPISGAGQKIAFDDSNLNIYTMSTTGTNITKVASGSSPTWSADGNKLIYQAYPTGSTKSQIYSVPATGGTPTKITPAAYASQTCANPTCSPDGKLIAFTVVSATSSIIVMMNSNMPSDYFVFSPSNVQDDSASFSPDSNSLVFARNGAATISDLNGTNTYGMYMGPATFCYAPIWSPFLAPQTFVGAGGTMYTNAAGFLMTRLGDSFASLVAFQAKTPSTATVTPAITGGAGGELVYNLHADTIYSISVASGYYLPAVPYVVSVADTQIYISSTTGQVQLVAPFLARTSHSATPTHKGSTLVSSASFTGVFDGQGKNLAPNGATQIILDEKTGKLISIR